MHPRHSLTSLNLFLLILIYFFTASFVCLNELIEEVGMFTVASKLFYEMPCQVVSNVSSTLYSGVQRVVALMLLTNQRYNYSSSSIEDLKTRRLTILNTPHQGLELEPNRLPKIIPVHLKNSQGHTLEGILMVAPDDLVYENEKPKVKDRLLVAYSGIGGCYENWYDDGLKDLYANYRTSILMVNYRGVGKSEGAVRTPADLLDDGYSIAMHAYNHVALDPSKIHFYGASMGGGVAINTVARLEKEGLNPASVCVDRSYSGLKETIYDMLPLLKSLFYGLMNYAAWHIDSLQAALGVCKAKVVVIRHESDSVIPFSSSLATALEDNIEGKALCKFIDLPKEELTEWEKMHQSDYPYWVIPEMEKTFSGRAKLKYLEWDSYIQKIFIGIRAHCVPFSKNLYPLQSLAYEKVLNDAEKKES